MDEMVEQTITKEVLKNWDVDVTYDQDTKKQLEDQMVFSYPYGTEQKTKQKISVSELKKRAYLEEDEIEEENEKKRNFEGNISCIQKKNILK